MCMLQLAPRAPALRHAAYPRADHVRLGEVGPIGRASDKNSARIVARDAYKGTFALYSLFGPVLLKPKELVETSTSGICTQRTEDGEGPNESIKNGTYLSKLNFRLAQAVARLRISTGLLSYRTRIHFERYVPFLLDSSPIIWSRNNGPATTKVLSKPVLYLVGNHGRTWSNSGGHNAQA